MMRHLSTAVILAVLSISPLQAYLPGRLCPRDGGSIRKSSSLCVATSSVVKPTAPAPGDPKDKDHERRKVHSVTGEQAGDPAVEGVNSRRWIQDIKSGDKIIGYVRDTTNFAAFVDIGVVRRGAKVRIWSE